MRPPRLAFLLVYLGTLLSMLGCGWRKAPDGVVVAIPHTGNVCGMSQCVLVSPDENWLVFFESATKGGGTVDFVASIDLHDSTYTRHDLERLGGEGIPRSLSPISSKLFYFLDGVERVGWADEQLVMDFGGGGRGLFFARGKRDAWIGKRHDGGLYVSDGINYRDMLNHAHSTAMRRHFNMSPDVFSMLVRDGVPSTDVYWYDVKSEWIMRSVGIGINERIWRNKKKIGKIVNVTGLRVSPNEQYIAIETVEQLAASVPTPYYRSTLLVREMSSGRIVQIGRYRYIANYMWSPDGARIYFVGGGDTDSFAVRVAHVDRVFKE